MILKGSVNAECIAQGQKFRFQKLESQLERAIKRAIAGRKGRLSHEFAFAFGGPADIARFAPDATR
jgi:hypothetical protein